VEGSAACFAQTVRVTGAVAKNLLAAVQEARVVRDAQIHGDFVAFAATAISEGAIARGIRVFSGRAQIDGSVGRNVDFYGRNLEIGTAAKINGDVNAHVGNRNDVRVAGSVGGQVNTIPPQARPADSFGAAAAGVLIWELVWLAAAFLTGIVLLRAAPQLVDGAAAAINGGWPTLGLGFVALVVTPAALLLLLITVVGIPVALTGAALFLFGLYAAKIVVAIWIGGRVLPAARPALGLLAGLTIVTVVLAIPFLGWLARLVVSCAGLGALAWTARRWLRSAPESERDYGSSETRITSSSLRATT
jgi:hypothetical protein